MSTEMQFHSIPGRPKHLPHVISYDVIFKVPAGERHTHAVFEALTGYMPPEFSRFLRFNPQRGELEALSDGPGEIPHPIVFATADGAHVMGIFSPPQSAPRISGPTFGRFRFAAEKVVKWNCVFRLRDESGIAPGEYPFRMFVIVGDVATVTLSLRALHRESANGMHPKFAAPHPLTARHGRGRRSAGSR